MDWNGLRGSHGIYFFLLDQVDACYLLFIVYYFYDDSRDGAQVSCMQGKCSIAELYATPLRDGVRVSCMHSKCSTSELYATPF